MKFKVGDKIKTISTFFIRDKAEKTGLVIEIYSSDKELPYRIEIGTAWSCPVYEYEIALYPKKGQQLLLFEI